jgi:hypothetical protein
MWSVFIINQLLYKHICSISLRVVNNIGGVMFSVLASSAVESGFEPLSGHIKDYKIATFCFFAKHAALRR